MHIVLRLTKRLRIIAICTATVNTHSLETSPAEFMAKFSRLIAAGDRGDHGVIGAIAQQKMTNVERRNARVVVALEKTAIARESRRKMLSVEHAIHV